MLLPEAEVRTQKKNAVQKVIDSLVPGQDQKGTLLDQVCVLLRP